MQNAVFIEVRAGVRYWEDGRLNGVEDEEGHMPLRNGDLWLPVIELATGKVLNWPEGVEAAVHYKVCDEGEYWLLNENRERIAQWKGYYVPNDILCMDGSGFGDYIILKIGGDGLVRNWRRPYLDEDQWRAL